MAFILVSLLLKKSIVTVEKYCLFSVSSCQFLRAHFNLSLTARAKISLSLAQNIFMPTKLN